LFSTKTRNIFFRNLNTCFQDFDFSDIRTSLQTKIDTNPLGFLKKYIITISTSKVFELEEKYENIENQKVAYTLRRKSLPIGLNSHEEGLLSRLVLGSIPDAWIYDKKRNFCLLIECKVGNKKIDYKQIIRHASVNYHIDDLVLIKKSIIKLTWNNILEAFDFILENRQFSNDQEKMIIQHLIQYLNFFGYALFKGLGISKLVKMSDIELMSNLKRKCMFNFRELRYTLDQNLVFSHKTNKSFQFDGVRKIISLNLLR